MGALKERQEDLDGKLDSMRSENEALWGEVLSLRQKHNQQQKIVNKLIQFLVALVQPRGMKRSYATSRGVPGLRLAIEDTAGEGPSAKQSRRQEPEEILSSSGNVRLGGGQTSIGPVIQEIHDTGALSDLLVSVPVVTTAPQQKVRQRMPCIIIQDEFMLNNKQQQEVSQPSVLITTPSMPAQPSPQQKVKETKDKYRLVDPISVNSSLVQKRPVLHREISKEDFDTDISSMQKDLDNLKDMLSGQITLDTSLVSSLFSSDSDAIGGM